MLKDKERQLMDALEKVTIANATQLTLLLDKISISTVRKKINELIARGYIASHQYEKTKLYYLTKKGLNEIERKHAPYEGRNILTEHFYYVTQAACWLHIKKGVPLSQMLFDRDIINHSTLRHLHHYPDIIWGNSCIEMELTSKSIPRLTGNIRNNADSFESQIWFVPNHLTTLRKRIVNTAEDYIATIQIITVEDLNAFVSNYDLHTHTKNENTSQNSGVDMNVPGNIQPMAPSLHSNKSLKEVLGI